LKNGSIYSTSGKKKDERLSQFLSDQISSGEKVVLKPITGVGGKEVYILSYNGENFIIDGDEYNDEELLNYITSDSWFLISEYVHQANYSKEIYSNSVNTVRIITAWDEEREEPFVIDAIHRFGTEQSGTVDNWDKGGLSVGIELESGRLLKATRRPKNDPELEWFNSHPNTGSKIEGVTIPNWELIVEGCLRMANELHYTPMIGWDIVITEDEFKVLEGNSRPSIGMMQVHKPLLLEERVRQFYNRHNVI